MNSYTKPPACRLKKKNTRYYFLFSLLFYFLLSYMPSYAAVIYVGTIFDVSGGSGTSLYDYGTVDISAGGGTLLMTVTNVGNGSSGVSHSSTVTGGPITIVNSGSPAYWHADTSSSDEFICAVVTPGNLTSSGESIQSSNISFPTLHSFSGRYGYRVSSDGSMQTGGGGHVWFSFSSEVIINSGKESGNYSGSYQVNVFTSGC